MSRATGGTAGPDAGSVAGELPADAAMAAARADLPGTEGALVVGRAAGTRAELSTAWAERRHLIVRCGEAAAVEEVVDRLRAAGVSAGTPALLAAELGTAGERLVYGSVENVAHPGFGAGAVLVVPHPGALPVDFAWPPTAAP